MKLNDNEVIKAMECCRGGETCPDECPFYSTDFKHSCIDDDGIMEQAYDLLIRQRDEIERLRGVIKILEADVKAAVTALRNPCPTHGTNQRSVCDEGEPKVVERND